ncbi:hypothetical protein ACVIYL_000213 [Bradyrhizobium sp. USDA 3315]
MRSMNRASVDKEFGKALSDLNRSAPAPCNKWHLDEVVIHRPANRIGSGAPSTRMASFSTS